MGNTFQTLRANTLNLDVKLSILLGRYMIVSKNTSPDPAPAAAVPVKTQNNLEVLIARTNKVLKCGSGRDTAVEVFKKLTTELRELVNEKDEDKINQATMFLLGALLHRYFRLLQEYKDWSTRLFTYDPFNSALFVAIREALQLNPNAKLADVGKDLEIMDVTTIVDCLESFKANMILEDEFKTPRYKKYTHFAKDEHFLPYLQKIIDEHKGSGRATLNQFKAIRFVQSLAKRLECERLTIDKELQAWSAILQKEYPDFNQLTHEMIVKHIEKHVKSIPAREKLLDLVCTEVVKSSLKDGSEKNHKLFIEAINVCWAELARYTLLGGYVLLIQSPEVNDKLRAYLYEALGCEEKQLTKKDMAYAVNFLYSLIELEPEIVLNFDFFGGKDKFKTEISQRRLSLNSALESQEKKPESSAYSLV